ncbi:carotenoid biosynthesis protein [Cytophagaceae bacterium 50C-KIRBA]|uniref:Carotenoid biosynthesis protein n=1 Tax=Aquirufa beregesia TaxID=2516556 RepID=A0ABX0EXT3_9BACT|nr:carotenoid biosynthesis protein [Aquirufa beregesia]NGZ44121.1 carotenoid biosynthesis protein [Aquirufa beregesia]
MSGVYLKRFLIVLYAVGLVGMNLPATQELFVSLVPLTLWFTGFICLFYFPKPSMSAYLTLGGIVVAAWFLEVVGVRTGKIFGVYHYGETLGFKVLDVPITIGINWLILLLGSSAVVEEWNVGGKIGRAALGAGLMTSLDLLIEPVAIHFDFWQWSGGQVPIQNFGAWWLVSFFFHWVFQSGEFTSKSSLFRWVLLLQFMFFLGHWIFLQA